MSLAGRSIVPWYGASLLLRMRTAWTLPKELSSTPRPADAPASCGPPVNFPGRTKWQPPRWAPLSNLTEWPPTRHVGSSSHSSPVFSGLLRNGCDKPWIAETMREATRTPRGVPLHPPQLVHGHHHSPTPGPATREVQPRQVRMQTHGSSYFLLGTITGKPAHFLLDSGCTTNILSRQLFDTLSVTIRKGLAPYEGDHGTLADGLCISFYGIIELTGRIREQTIQETFIVRQLNEDAILGMPFLQRHGCRIDFSKSAMLMGDRELACVDKFGRPLAGGAQIVRSCTIPGHSRGTVHCKVEGGYSSRLGVVESTHARIQPAGSLNRLTGRGEIWVQCVNPFLESVNLPSSSTLGRFHSVREEDSGPSWETTTEGPRQHPSQRRRTVPHHAPRHAEMHGRYWDNSVSNGERRGKAKLLHQHGDIPHQGGRSGSLNRATRREVPLVAGTALTQQTSRTKGRGSPQSKPDKQDSPEAEPDRNQGQLQPGAGMPPEVPRNLRAKPVWTSGLNELRHIQGNSPGVVAKVYRAKHRDRDAPSYGCTVDVGTHCGSGRMVC